MSDLPSPSQSKYTYLASLSTDALKALLRADIEASTDDDYDTTYFILEILEQREMSCPTGCLSDVDTAWADFQQHFNTPEGEGVELYPRQDISVEELDETTISPTVPPRKTRRITHIFKYSTAAALILIFSLIFVQATGSNFLEAFATWTSETFRFIISDNSNTPPFPAANPLSEVYYNNINAALDDIGITEKLAPTWYPDGFECDDIITQGNRSADKVYSTFSNDDDLYFDVVIYRYHSPSSIGNAIVEKDDGPVEEHTSNGRTFFIMSNIDTYAATWTDAQSLVIFISGNISKDEIITIIDSIGE